MKGRICTRIAKARETGFFHIISFTAVSKILALISGILIVRIVSKSEYGRYSYAANILSYFNLFSGLGITSAVFQICCEKQKDGAFPRDVFGYGVFWGHLINIVLGGLVVAYSLGMHGDIPGSETYLRWMCLIPLANISFDLAAVYFRSRLEIKSYAYMFLVSAIATFLFSILGSLLFGVRGMIYSKYLTPLVSVLFACVWKGYKPSFCCRLEKRERVDVWRLAFTSLVGDALTQIMYLVDISMIGWFMKDELEVASYKIATIIPTALRFFAVMILSYVYPFFARHASDTRWSRVMAWRLIALCCCFFGCMSALFYAFARPIIVGIFCYQYLDAVGVFRILMVNFFFQTSLSMMSGSLLMTQRKLAFHVWEGIISCLLNIVGDYVLIGRYQAKGVAMVTLVVTVFSSTLATSYYFYSLHKKERALDKAHGIR